MSRFLHNGKMKILVCSLLIAGFTISSLRGDNIVIDGIYQGKNLYVLNPFGPEGVGFCVYEVRVNGNVTTDEINSSSFEIDLTVHNLKIGDKVEVIVKHKEGCKPKVINPEVLKPRSTFELVDIKVEGDQLIWTTKNEMGSLPFIIEQFRWNKWIKIGEVDGKGTPQENTYRFKLLFHSGENQFRIKQIDFTGKPRISKIVKVVSDQPPVSFSPKKVKDKITFSSPTMYEIYNSYGDIVKKGYGSEVDCSDLPKGIYYLAYDNKVDEILKK